MTERGEANGKEMHKTLADADTAERFITEKHIGERILLYHRRLQRRSEFRFRHFFGHRVPGHSEQRADHGKPDFGLDFSRDSGGEYHHLAIACWVLGPEWRQHRVQQLHASVLFRVYIQRS